MAHDKRREQQVNAEEAARRQLALIRSLKECPGWHHYLLPRIKAIRDGMQDRILTGKCEDHATYQAEVKLVQALNDTVLNALERDEERLAATLAKG